MAPPKLVVLAKLTPEEKKSFGVLANAVRLELSAFERVEAALAAVDAHEPRVVVFDSDVAQADKLLKKIRSRKDLASVPILALLGEPSDALVERLYSLGADDVVAAGHNAGLMTRIRALPDKSALTHAAHGTAVVADKEHARCDVVGRVLMNAGYDVKYALDDVALRYYTQQSSPKLVIQNADVGEPRRFIDEARKKGNGAAWVVMAARRDVVKLAAELDGLERVTVLVHTTAPENVLFTSNELLGSGAAALRKDERVLYGTLVAYKVAGSEQEETGFSYNLSRGGLYVRSLAPMEGDRVWVELRPPRAKSRVRLEGRVAWRRSYDPASGASAPPGFGVALTDGLGDSMALWTEHVEAFVRSTRRGPQAVAKLLEETLGEARASQPEIERPSHSHIAAIPISLPAPAEPKAPRSVPPPLPPAAAVRPQPPPLPGAEASPPPPAAAVPRPPPLPGAAAVLQLPATPVLDDGAAPAPQIPTLPVTSLASKLEPPSEVPPAVPKRSLLVPVLGLLVVAMAAVTALVLLGVGPFAPKSPPATAAAPAPKARESTAARAASATLPATPSPSSAPTASAATSAPPAASAASPPTPSEAPDLKALLWDEGYLLVRSPASADVYATGFKVGPTNQANKSKCGLKFVKIGEKDPPRWLSKGQTVDVKCRQLTEVEIRPE
ncbi:MAG: PilZ domain-containing protein [Polyangiaceae bacterium]